MLILPESVRVTGCTTIASHILFIKAFMDKSPKFKKRYFLIFKDDGLLSFHYGENGARNYFVLDGKVI